MTKVALPKRNGTSRTGDARVPSGRGELALIERIRQRATMSGVATHLELGIGDDCAILRPPAGHELLVTTDFSLEGRHFRREWHSAQSVGHRTLARGLSDLAAMGALPLAAFLSLALPKEIAKNTPWLDGFLDGLLGLADQSEVPLAGGDTSEAPSGQVLADIVLLGSAPAGTALRRSGASPGDLLYCTGRLGGAAAELDALGRSPGRYVEAKSNQSHPHLFPRPRLRTGRLLREQHLASACMDLSDGISTDLAHLCSASHVAAVVEWDKLPLSPLLRRSSKERRESAALHGGEDYELLFTARPEVSIPKRLGGADIHLIGEMVKARRGQPQVTLVDAGGERLPLVPAGWEHFR